jgi:hypothetical protein
VICQAIVPLIEIVKRRSWLEEKEASELRDLAFALLDVKYSGYPAIVEYLVRLFCEYTDLSEEDAKEVLSRLEKSDDSAVLFIYYAIDRRKLFKEKGEFDSTYFEDLLKQKIEVGDPALRGSIAWHLCDLIQEPDKKYEELKGYVTHFTKSRYDQTCHEHLLRTSYDLLEEHFDMAYEWIMNSIESSLLYVKDRPVEGDIRIWGHHYEDIAEKLAAMNKGKELLDLIEKLVELAIEHRGVIINLLNVFNAVDNLASKPKGAIKRLNKLWEMVMIRYADRYPKKWRKRNK